MTDLILYTTEDGISQIRLRAQEQTVWLTRHIVEFEQGGAARAAYGKGLLVALAGALTADFGKGFDATNLRHMRDFYLSFPICDALRRELSWTHYRRLLRVDSPTARQWYVQEAAGQNWSTRVLERQICPPKKNCGWSWSATAQRSKPAETWNLKATEA